MRYEKEFQKWNKEFNISKDQSLKVAHFNGWEACEDFYESRKCEGCDYSFKRSNFPPYLLACRKGVNISNSFDFYCKYWEPKTLAKGENNEM